jgi:hypothetical protein
MARWSPGTNWQKAKFFRVDNGRDELIVECHFNPEQYAISQVNQWKEDATATSTLPGLNLKTLGLREIKNLTLWFDTYEQQADVRTATDKLRSMMAMQDQYITKTVTVMERQYQPWSWWSGGWGMVPVQRTVSEATKPRPPMVVFAWGGFRSFSAVVTNMTQTFTLFLADGTPVRAKVAISIKEAPLPQSGQNPTSRAAGARRSRMVQLGDTLDWIATEELGDPNAWRLIAEINDLEDPRRLRPGQILLIPSAS